MSLTSNFSARKLLTTVDDRLSDLEDLLIAMVLSGHESLLSITNFVLLASPSKDLAEAVVEVEDKHDVGIITGDLSPWIDDDAREHKTPVLPPEVLTSSFSLTNALAPLVAPGGMMVVDVELSDCKFVHPDRLWEAMAIATNVRGRFDIDPPVILPISAAMDTPAWLARWFREMLGIHEEVLPKYLAQEVIVPRMATHIHGAFPWQMRTQAGTRWIASKDMAAIETAHDVVLWPEYDLQQRLGGRYFETPHHLGHAGNPENRVWKALLEDRLDPARRAGIPTDLIGGLVDNPAMLIYNMRNRLAPAFRDSAIPNVTKAYALTQGGKYALVTSCSC